jgi:broad specificity phosphatase PhoE
MSEWFHPAFLVLIRHAPPEIIPDLPAEKWQLSPEGQKLCQPMARPLKRFQPQRIYHSTEPKARETAQGIANELKIPHLPWRDLHEHRRSQTPYTSQENFTASVRDFFAHPTEPVFGLERAEEALHRFSTAIHQLLRENPRVLGGTTLGGQMPANGLLVVSHGTVISLFTARHNSMDAFTFWEQLKMPCAVVLRLPSFQFVEILPPGEN